MTGVKNWWHRQNEFCDCKAKLFLQNCTKGPTRQWREHLTPKLIYETWEIYLNNTKLACVDKEDLYAAVYGSKSDAENGKSLLHYLKNHHDMPVGNCDLVDWELLRATRQSLLMGFNRWITKFSSGFIGNGHMLRHQGWQDSNRCPLCKCSNEKSSHLLKC